MTRLNAFRKWPLQGFNRVTLVQFPEGRGNPQRTFADEVDCMALRAMRADEDEAPLCGRRLRQGCTVRHQREDQGEGTSRTMSFDYHRLLSVTAEWAGSA